MSEDQSLALGMKFLSQKFIWFTAFSHPAPVVSVLMNSSVTKLQRPVTPVERTYDGTNLVNSRRLNAWSAHFEPV